MRLIDRPTNNDKVEHDNLTEEELKLILETVEKGAGNSLAVTKQKNWKDRDLAIFYTLLFTGMRESALCEMDMDKIDFKNDTLTVVDKGHKTNEYEISSKLRTHLLRWLETRENLLGDKECDAIFISNRRSRITPLAVSNIVAKYAKEAIGREVTPHRIRAAYITMIYKETGDIELASKAAKHRQISTTRIYIGSDEKEINKKATKIISSKF
jgi:integrase/recombinase XerD